MYVKLYFEVFCSFKHCMTKLVFVTLVFQGFSALSNASENIFLKFIDKSVY